MKQEIKSIVAQLEIALAGSGSGATVSIPVPLGRQILEVLSNLAVSYDVGTVQRYGLSPHEADLYAHLLTAGPGAPVSADALARRSGLSKRHVWVLKHRICLKLAAYNQRIFEDPERKELFLYLISERGAGYYLESSQEYVPLPMKGGWTK